MTYIATALGGIIVGVIVGIKAARAAYSCEPRKTIF